MSGYFANLEDFDRLFFTNEELVDNFTGVTLYTWGRGAISAEGSQTNRSVPTKAAGSNINWKQTDSTAASHAAVIKTDGTLWTWGNNFGGQLGEGTTNARFSPGTTAGGGTNWRYVSTGDYHTLAIKTDGTLWSFGQNFAGQLGIGSFDAGRSSPVSVLGGFTDWVYVVAGRQFSAGIRSTGELYTWGSNNQGELGLNDVSARWTPVTVVGGGTNWKNVSIGYQHTVAVKTDGTLWTWGWNDFGQLGDGTTNNRSSPGTTAVGGTNWKIAVGGQKFSAAIKTDGTIWTWGLNTNGQLGTGTTTNRSTPGTIINGGTLWKSITSGNANISAIKTDGTLWSWGRNNFGQLGDGTTVNKSSAVSITAPILWKQVACGYESTWGLGEF